MPFAESITDIPAISRFTRIGIATGAAIATLIAPHLGCDNRGWKEFPRPGLQAEGLHTGKAIVDDGTTVIDFKQTRIALKVSPQGK